MISYDMPMSDYLAHQAIGSSTLKNIMLTPADYKAALEQKSNETKATTLGTAVHTLILEPHKFDAQYALQPQDWGPRNVGMGKKNWDAFKKENQGKIVISFEEAWYLRRLARAAAANSHLIKIREESRAEVTGFINYNSQIQLKARSDLFGSITLWDLKTTSESMDDDNLFKIVFNYGYHFQAAHHMLVFKTLGIPIFSFGWIFVSTKTPACHIRLVKAPAQLLEWGKKDHTFALNRLEECLNSNTWEGYPSAISTLTIPEWTKKIYE